LYKPCSLVESMFVDVHCHITDPLFNADRDSIIRLAASKGLIIVNAGEDIESDALSLELQSKYENVKACIGLHPNAIVKKRKEEIERDLAFMDSEAKHSFAISEVGLDYKGKSLDQINLEKQILIKIFEMAEKDRKPVIIHTRKAMEDMLGILSSFKIKAILHNFEGNSSQCQRACDMGLGISVSTGFLKFKKDSIIRKIRNDLIFTETDSPALSPNDQRNTPLNVIPLIEYISRIRGQNFQQTKELIYSNFLRMFYD